MRKILSQKDYMNLYMCIYMFMIFAYYQDKAYKGNIENSAKIFYRWWKVFTQIPGANMFRGSVKKISQNI